MKKIALLLVICMLSIVTMPTISAIAQPKGDNPSAEAPGKGKGHDKNDAKKAPDENNPEAKKPSKGKNDVKDTKNIGSNQNGSKKGKFSGRAPTYHNGVIVSTNLTRIEIRPLAVSYGLIGYKPLPPGIRKNLMRGKPLPPGIAKKLVPNVLLIDLPRYSGYEWRIAGTDLILVALATAKIIDILSDIFD